MSAIFSPILGLIYNKPGTEIPPGGLSDGYNFRCKNGTLQSANMGWVKFSTNWQLNGSVLLIDQFNTRTGVAHLIFSTKTDLYQWNQVSDTVTYLTPTYIVGTASASGTAVTGSGTTWSTNAKAGDQIAFGVAGQTSTSATWYTVQTVNNDTSITLTASAGTIASGPYTIRRLLQGANSSIPDSAQFLVDGSGSDLWFYTNGVDYVVTWDGVATSAIYHPELNIICKRLCNYKNMMIYGNITVSGVYQPTSIINSDVGWALRAGATGIQLSNQFEVHSNSDEIFSLRVLGPNLIVYSERTITTVQFVGAPVVFAFTQAVQGHGPIGPRAIAPFGYIHEFIGHDRGYSFDGVNLREVNSHVMRDIIRQIDTTRQRFAFAHFNEEQGEVEWSVPLTSDPGQGVIGSSPVTAWVENYLEVNQYSQYQGSPFAKRNYPFTCAGYWLATSGAQTWASSTGNWISQNFAWNDKIYSTSFPLNLVGDVNGFIYITDTVQTGNGAILPSFVHTGRQLAGSGREFSLITRIYPWTTLSPGNSLDVSLYTTKFVGTPATLAIMMSYDMSNPDGRHFVTPYRRGRAYELAFGSSIGIPWTVTGWDVDMVLGGRR